MCNHQLAIMPGNRKFVPADAIAGGNVVYCDEAVLAHSEIFKTLFEMSEDPIIITRDFGLFVKVIDFAKNMSQERRYNVLKDEATRDLIVAELDFYGVMGPTDSRSYLLVEAFILDEIFSKTALVKNLTHYKVAHAGFLEVFQKTVARKDIGPPEKHLVLRVLVAQAQLYYKTMYRRMYNSKWAQPQYLEWFKNPNSFGITIDAKYKLPKTDRRPAWVKLDIQALVEAKDGMMVDLKKVLPDEEFNTAGIDALFDCSASYDHPVELVSLMRAVLHHVGARLEACATANKRKAHINMIRKYLANPCKTVLGKN